MNLQTNLNDGVQIDDLKEMKPLEAAIKAQQEYLALNQEMKIVMARRNYTRDRLISELEARGSDRDGNDDGTVLVMRKVYPKVTDFDELVEYVYALDEPVSTYLKEVFIKGNKSQGIEDPLERLVARAINDSLETGKHISECLPPGLSISSDTQLRVTLKKKKEGKLESAVLRSKYPELDAALEEK